MSKIHFIHTSDWHLGFNQYNKIERYNDFYNAADQMVDKAIQLKPQFILHTGDLFHHQIPSPGAIRQAVRLLRKFKRNDIPVYMIRGNHDAKNSKLLQRGGNVISLLDDLKLIHFVDDEIVHPQNNVNIIGVGYYTGQSSVFILDELFDDFTPDKTTFDIIAMHAYIEGQLERNVQISLKDLNEYDVNYIGMGHYHIPWQNIKRQIYVPGSTETTSTNDWRRGDTIDQISMFSSFYEIKSTFENNVWQSVNVTTHKINVRPKILLNINSKANNIDNLIEEINTNIKKKKEQISRIGGNSDSAILKLDILSELDIEELSMLSSDEFLENNNLFHVILTYNGTEKYKDIEIENFVERNIENVILKLLKEETNPDQILQSIMELIDIYGNSKLKDVEERDLNEFLLLISNVIGDPPKDGETIDFWEEI